MMPLILLLFLAFSSATRVDLAETLENMDALALQIRKDYVAGLDQQIECFEEDVGRYGISLIQAEPPANLNSLHLNVQTKREDGSRANPPEVFLEPGETGLIKITSYFDLEELTDAYGCVEIPDNEDYFGRICYFIVDYFATDSGLTLATVEYSLAVRIPKHNDVEYIIKATKIYKELCDCEILNEYTLQVEAYIDAECEVPLEGDTLVYGSLLCLKVFTTDALAQGFLFNPTSVLMVYKDIDGNDRTVEMIPVAETLNGRGMSEIVMDVLAVGDFISYTITVRLEGGLRALVDVNLRRLSEIKENSGIQGGSKWFKIVKEGSSDDSKSTSSASSLIQSVFALFIILGVMLL